MNQKNKTYIQADHFINIQSDTFKLVKLKDENLPKKNNSTSPNQENKTNKINEINQ